MASQWYYAFNGQKVGPVAFEQLQSLLAAGTVKPTDLVWSESLPAWTAAHQVPGLQATTPHPNAAPAVAPAPRSAMAVSAPSSEGASEEAIALLRMTKPWVRFLSVLGFIGLGLVVLGSFVFLVMPLGPAGVLGIGSKLAISLVYLLMAGIQFPAVLFLSRYATRIQQVSVSGAPSDLVEALRAQKAFWKYVGILTLVMMILYLLILIGVLAVGGAALLGR